MLGAGGDLLESILSAVNSLETVLGGLAAFFSWLAGTAWSRRFTLRKKRAMRVSQRIGNILGVQELLTEVAVSVDCQRAAILVAENGSHWFPAYATVIYEVVLTDEIRGIKHECQRVPLDRSYRAKIGAAVNTTSDFEVVLASKLPGGNLKDFYTVARIIYSAVVPLLRSHCDDWAVYLSCNYQTAEKLTEEQRARIRRGAAAIRVELRKHLPE